MKKVFILLAMFLICSAVYANMGFANLRIGMSFDSIDSIYDTEFIEEQDGNKSYIVDISKSELSNIKEPYYTTLDIYEDLFSSFRLYVTVDENNKVSEMIAITVDELETIRKIHLGMFYAYTAAYGFPTFNYTKDIAGIDYTWQEDGIYTYASACEINDSTGAIFITITPMPE